MKPQGRDSRCGLRRLGLHTHAQPTGRDRLTFKLFLDLFSYFNVTHGKLMQPLVGSTTVHRTIAPPGTRSPPDSIYTPID